MRLFALLIALTSMSCGATIVTDVSSDREKQIVSGDDYLLTDDCWGGVGLREQGTWIPVEFAVDEGEYFTKVGIVSRSCEIAEIADFVNEARGEVPPYFVAEWHADFFVFSLREVKDADGLLASNRLLTSGSTTTVRYSDKVVFFDGYMKLGSPIQYPVGGGQFFNVVEIARLPR